MGTKHRIHIMVNGQNIETRPCRHCGTGMNGPKLRPITEMRMIKHGWYCQDHAKAKLAHIRRERGG